VTTLTNADEIAPSWWAAWLAAVFAVANGADCRWMDAARTATKAHHCHDLQPETHPAPAWWGDFQDFN
jgi:hypothetical protein